MRRFLQRCEGFIKSEKSRLAMRVFSICLLGLCFYSGGGIAEASVGPGISQEFGLPIDMIRDLIVSKFPAKYITVTRATGNLIDLNLPMIPATCHIELDQVDENRTKFTIQCRSGHLFISRSDLKAAERHRLDKLTELVSDARLNMRMQQQEASRTQALEDKRAQQMKEMLKEVVAATSKGQKEQVKSAAVRSDIDKPEFAVSQRVMGENDLAVIIGIEGYQNLPKSDYSYDDAKLVKDYVKALGFKERNIELLIDEKATKSSIEKSLEAWIKNKAKPDSKVFIYYSGHGAPDPSTGEAYLVPYDGDPNYLNITGYPLRRLYDNLGKLQVAEVVVVLDACFSGAGGRSVLAKGARPLVMMTTSTVLPSNIAVLSATQGTQISTSSTEKGHGVFTYYFLKALKDGKKTLAEIYEYIKPNVEDEAKQLNVQQSPSISPDMENIKGRFSLRK
jgi:hypothetical protein